MQNNHNKHYSNSEIESNNNRAPFSLFTAQNISQKIVCSEHTVAVVNRGDSGREQELEEQREEKHMQQWTESERAIDRSCQPAMVCS